MNLATRVVLVWLLLNGAVAGMGADAESYAKKISSLVGLAKPRDPGVNDRVLKYVAQLAEAKQAGQAPEEVAAKAVALTTMGEELRKLTTEAMLRNLKTAQELGCLDAEGLAELRKGKAPTVRRGPHQGDRLHVDQIIPRDVCPDLHNLIANLELAPQKIIAGKGGKIGKQQLDLARKLSQAGLMQARDVMEIEDRLATGR